MYRALSHRNYRLFFGGQIVSLVGTFLTLTATSWLVLRMTQSARMLGLVAFCGQIGMFVLAPVAGVWADRVNRRRLLVATQLCSMVISLTLAGLALSHRITVNEIIVLNLCQGVVTAFDMPCRQAFTVEMVVNQEDLQNAIALNSMMFHSARLLGPALAGLLISFFGEGYCFLVDGVSFIGVVIALLLMDVKPRVRKKSHSMVRDLKEGFVYVWRFLPIRVLLIVLAMVSLTGLPALSVLMPIFAEHFGGMGSAGARLYGFFGTVMGLGAVTASFFLASRTTVLGLGRLIAIACAVFGLALAAFAMSPWLWLSLLIMPIAGWGMIAFAASANTVMQTLADDDKRGRVMSLFSMSFVGMTPLGNLMAGALAAGLCPVGAEAVVGASRTLLLESVVCLAAAVVFARMLPQIRKIVRPIYMKKGIIPMEAVLPIASE